MAVPNIFAAATGSIPLSQLDANFATPITIGNSTVTLGNSLSTIGNLTLTNVTLTSLSAAIQNSFLANSSIIFGNTSVSLGGTATAINALTLSNVSVISGTVSNVTISTLSSPIDVISGGTGIASPGASGNVLSSNGAGGWVSSVPSSSVLPSGAVMPFAMQTPPTGWLEANGSAISRTTYAALFSALGTLYGIGDGTTTFNLPDLRGEFVRGWDHGRGVDSGRVFGSTQTSAYTNHSHTASSSTSVSASDLGHAHSYVEMSTGGAIAGGGDYTYNGANTGTAYADISASASTSTTVNASTTGATETRPVNIAMLYCIKT